MTTGYRLWSGQTEDMGLAKNCNGKLCAYSLTVLSHSRAHTTPDTANGASQRNRTLLTRCRGKEDVDGPSGSSWGDYGKYLRPVHCKTNHGRVDLRLSHQSKNQSFGHVLAHLRRKRRGPVSTQGPVTRPTVVHTGVLVLSLTVGARPHRRRSSTPYTVCVLVTLGLSRSSRQWYLLSASILV